VDSERGKQLGSYNFNFNVNKHLCSLVKISIREIGMLMLSYRSQASFDSLKSSARGKRLGVLARIARSRANLLGLVAVAVTLILNADVVDVGSAGVLCMSA